MHVRPLPVSTRHAFALAFDLAFRRDPLHSLIVPFCLRAPWLAALALLPTPEQGVATSDVLLVWSLAAIGFTVALLLVDAMLRFRARSVFNQARDVSPAPVGDCYASGIRRVGWLYLTEVVRTFLLVVGFGVFILPGIWIAHRLAFATEAVVLTRPTLAQAFRHSYHLTAHRFERWVEMMLASVTLMLGLCLLGAILYVLSPITGIEMAELCVSLTTVFMLPVVQYAWTFFYLRLLESDEPILREVGPVYAAAHPTGNGAALPPAVHSEATSA
jgi:hypothetical protein